MTRGGDLGLLVLRVGAGLSLCVLFGVTKLKDAAHYMQSGYWSFVEFNRRVGLPVPVVVAYVQTLNESVGALLVAAGWCTRSAAASLCGAFIVAAASSHEVGEAAWLTAAYFALMFGTVALTGPGSLSVDRILEGRAAAKRHLRSAG